MSKYRHDAIAQKLGRQALNAILEGLNEQQAQAVRTVTGPLCILAGAGSGKTTTITRRIANQVLSGAFSVRQILAVTFTDKAAKEMAGRLQALGISAVRVKTFHAEALSQLRQFSTQPQELLSSKGRILKSLVQALPPPYKFTTLRDIATEIEWAKNARITSQRYLDNLGDHQPPVPADLMARLYASYERRKSQAKLIDFEDLLEKSIELLVNDPNILEQVQGRYKAFTVDEYQDVNLLQQTLLDTWVGAQRDVCVVGDDYQSIFGFTGADARYLLAFAGRFSDCRMIELTHNYRSTPQILDVANKLNRGMVGSTKILRATRSTAAAPLFKEFAVGSGESEWIVNKSLELSRQGLAWEDIAILYRINARSEQFEDALSQASIPYQVADSPFLRRPAAQAVIRELKMARGTDLAHAIETAVVKLGYRPDVTAQADEATRQADLARLLAMGLEYPGEGGIDGFIEDLQKRFSQEEGRGIQLMSYHRAKGKEYRAVFLPRLEEGELPFALAKSPDARLEERRLFYVGITRAKDFLFITWARYREAERRPRREPSCFLSEIDALASAGNAGVHKAAGGRDKAKVPRSDWSMNSVLENDLRQWRLQTAREMEVPAYVIFHDSTLLAVAAAEPRTLKELQSVRGIGPSKIEAYGPAILKIVAAHLPAGSSH